MMMINEFMCRRFAAFLFDMDGTIVDSSVAAENVWGGWARDHQIPTPAYHGRRAEDTISDLGLAGVDARSAAADITARELVETTGITEIDGARQFLSALPTDKWAVVTSAPRALAQLRMRLASLPLPRTMVCAEDVGSGKPSPDPFRIGAALLSVDPSNCLAFEDADAGIEAAENAGCSVLVISKTGASASTRRPSVPDFTRFRPSVVDGALMLQSR